MALNVCIDLRPMDDHVLCIKLFTSHKTCEAAIGNSKRQGAANNEETNLPKEPLKEDEKKSTQSNDGPQLMGNTTRA